MAQLSLKTRRRNARGISYRAQAGWAARNFWGKTNRAVLELGTGNAKVLYTSKKIGAAGNDTTIAYVVAGNSTPLGVAVVGTAITVNVATDGAGVALSTGDQVASAVNFANTANALVWANVAGGADGRGTVAAAAATNLAGATATPVF